MMDGSAKASNNSLDFNVLDQSKSQNLQNTLDDSCNVVCDERAIQKQ